MTSTSYVNSDGGITDAIDMGYATVCRMRDDNDRVVEERYLDASGNLWQGMAIITGCHMNTKKRVR